VRIITSLLHADYKENLMTRFSTNKQNRFLRPVYFYLCCHGNGTYISLTIKKTKVCVVNFLAAIFGDCEIKGFREKGE